MKDHSYVLQAWTPAQFHALRQTLQAIADEKYRRFTARIVPFDGVMLGVRMPLLRRLAADIAQGDVDGFLALCAHETYEETLLAALVTAMARAPWDRYLQRLAAFVPRINNWAVCDGFCATLRIPAKNQEAFWQFLQPYIQSEHEFSVRFALVAALSRMLSHRQPQELFALCEQATHSGYYVRMAVAWLLSVCVVRWPEPTLEYLTKCQLDDFTLRKTLCKIVDSRRTGSDARQAVSALRAERGW